MSSEEEPRSGGVVHRYNAEVDPYGSPESWARALGLDTAFLAGAFSAVVGAVPRGVTKEDLPSYFAYACNHKRYASTLLNVTRYEDNWTEQIEVAWDHPALVEARENGIMETGLAILCSERERDLLDRMEVLESQLRAESFALANAPGNPMLPLTWARSLGESADEVLSRHADNPRIRELHATLHSVLQDFVNETKDRGIRGTTHAKVSRRQS